MERRPAKIIKNGSKYQMLVDIDQLPNLDHIETVSGSKDKFYIDYEIADTRKARPQQRRLFFALIGDIWNWSGQLTEELKEYFYIQYAIKTNGKVISLKNESKSSVSDVNQLLDLVIDFMFDWNVPFKEGYKLLPKEEEYYLYQCCRHRICTVCGKHADIHHLDTIGMGGNRTKVDHTKRHVIALCREHHQEIETIHNKAFAKKYHVPLEGIMLDEETLRKIGVKGKYGE